MWRWPSNTTVLIVGALWLVLASSPLVGAEDPSTGDVTVDKTSERLHFKVPPDWPIEKRGGIMAPIPIEEYLARKFQGLQTQLQSIEQRVNGLDLRVRVLEEAAKKPQNGLRSVAPPASSTEQDDER